MNTLTLLDILVIIKNYSLQLLKLCVTGHAGLNVMLMTYFLKGYLFRILVGSHRNIFVIFRCFCKVAKSYYYVTYSFLGNSPASEI